MEAFTRASSLVLVAALLGCGGANLGNGKKPCGSNDACPTGYTCQDTTPKTCWKDGSYVVVDGGAGSNGGAGTNGGAGSGGSAGTDAAVGDGGDTGVVVPKVTVSIQRLGNGTITGDGVNCTDASCDVQIDVGSNLVLEAHPAADSDFKSWSGCTSSNGASCSLVAIAGSMQVTVTFAVKNANFVIMKDGNGAGSVAASWTGGGPLACGTSCSAVIPKGTVVTLTATPDTGSTVAWGVSGCTGTGPCMVTIGDGETDAKATFTLSKVTLTVARTGNGTISGTGGVNCADASCPVSVNYGDMVTLQAAPGADSDFKSWTGCTTTNGATCVVANIKAAAMVTAAFSLKKIDVTIQRSGNGKISSADGAVNCTMTSCTVSVDSGSALSLTATPDADSDFKSWSGCTTTTGMGCSLTGITKPTTVSATFAIKNASFVVSKIGNGNGTVSATWTGGGSLSCGAVCSANIPQGTAVSVTGTPAAESTLAWSGPCTGSGACSLTVPTGGTTLTATFTLVKYNLTVAANAGGTVTATGINCTTFPCVTPVDSGSSVALTATPAAEYTFAGWSGCTTTTGAVCNAASIKAATTVTASFALKQYPLTVQLSGNGSVSGSGVTCASASCVSNFASGSNITLTAAPGSDSDFKTWSGCTTTTGTTCTVTSIKAAATVTATFALKNASFNVVKNGNGAGTVTASWSGGSLNCGTTCSAQIQSNTAVTSTATPSTGSSVSWNAPCSGAAPCMVAISPTGTTVTATFTLIKYPLTVSLAGPSGIGSVASNTSGVTISCGSTCSASVDYGTSVQLVPTATAAGQFSSWTGCTSVTGTTCNVTVSGATNVIATFKLKNGQSCSSGSDCTTGVCVEGVCCDVACGGTCRSCLGANTGGANGTCGNVKAGTGHGSDCAAADVSTCGNTGACDGVGGCQKFPATAVCKGESCTVGTSTYSPMSLCNGSGSCVPQTQSCGNFKCTSNGVRCASSCSQDTDCASVAYCSTNTCAAKLGAGTLCSRNEQCSSALCGGRCCNAGSPCTCTQPHSANLIVDANFDDATRSKWSAPDGPSALAAHSSIDQEGCPFSGSMQITSSGGYQFEQCIPVPATATRITYGIWFKRDATASLNCYIATYDAPGCDYNTAVNTTYTNTDNPAFTGTSWTKVGQDQDITFAPRSVRFGCAGGGGTINFDHAYVTVDGSNY